MICDEVALDQMKDEKTRTVSPEGHCSRQD